MERFKNACYGPSNSNPVYAAELKDLLIKTLDEKYKVRRETLVKMQKLFPMFPVTGYYTEEWDAEVKKIETAIQELLRTEAWASF